jgi:hypothetical protein
LTNIFLQISFEQSFPPVHSSQYACCTSDVNVGLPPSADIHPNVDTKDYFFTDSHVQPPLLPTCPCHYNTPQQQLLQAARMLPMCFHCGALGWAV